MSAPSTTPNPGSAPRLSQRQVFIAKMAAIAVLAACAIGAAVYFRERSENPTMPEVVRVARTAMTLDPAQAAARKVDGIAFPDWSSLGWTLTGGRSDTLGKNRVAETALYQRGGRSVTLTIVAGTGEVANSKRAVGTPTTLQVGGRPVTFLDFGYGANVLSDSALYIYKRTVNGRTVVLTGAPISNALHDEMDKLIVTGLDPGSQAAGTTPTA